MAKYAEKVYANHTTNDDLDESVSILSHKKPDVKCICRYISVKFYFDTENAVHSVHPFFMK